MGGSERGEERDSQSRTLVPLAALHALMHIMATTLPALSPLVKADFQLSNTYVGLLSFAFALAIGVGSIISGLLSDRYAKLPLICGGFLGTAVFASMLFLSHDFLVLTLVFICMGLFLSLYHPSALAYISVTTRSNRGRAFGLHEVGGSIGLAIAPLSAGIISLYLNWRFTYLIWLFPALLFTLMLLKAGMNHGSSERGHEHPHHHNQNHTHSPGSLKLFFTQTLREVAVMRIYMIEILFAFIIGGALTFIPIFLNEAKGVAPQLAVLLACVFTGGGAIGKFIGGHFADIKGERWVMATGFFIITPLFMLVPGLPLFWCVLTLALTGIILPTVLPAILTTLSKEVGPSQIGMAFGMLMFAGFGFGSTSRLILGVVGDVFGISTVFYPLAIAALIGGLLNVHRLTG